jgi:hypothetical protein
VWTQNDILIHDTIDAQAMKYMTNLLLDCVGEESRMSPLAKQKSSRIKALPSMDVSPISLAVDLPEEST